MDPVLIVDDEKDNLEALKRLLRTEYDVTTSGSALEALQALRKKTFNVIVSDQRMPDISGVELLEKAKDICPQTTRILLTGYTDLDSVIGAINRGNIYRYVAKPWDPEDLRLTLRQANEACLLRREIEQTNEALSKSNAELKKALSDLTLLDRAKARFLSLVSHELNTPLTVMGSFVGLLLEDKGKLPKELQKAVGSISEANSRLHEIVEEVLTFVRLESEGAAKVVEIDLTKEIKDATSALKKEWAAKKLTVETELPKKLGFRGDLEKWRLALRYFLKDSISRSPQGTTLLWEATEKAGGVECKILREGEALSPDVLAAFVPTTKPMNHQKNLGLSLSILKTVVERHGGSLQIEKAKGKVGLSFLLVKDPSR